MNRIFKSKWSVARQTYVVTDEAHSSKDHKKTIAAAMSAAIAMIAGAAQAAYVEPGFVAENSLDVAQAKASWETDEYLTNWGLTAEKASSAYALGYYGQGVKVGMMDSGFLKDHVELTGDRWHAVQASGEYTHDGERYPQYGYPDKNADTGEYHAGDHFDVDGYYNPEFNDNHGTGCVGVMAGNRNGTGMHGVAWGSEIYSANTGGTDDSNYGPFPDYGFFKAGYDALVNSGVKIINNSFGTNLKQVDENGNILDYYHSGPELTTVNDIEYEYFLFHQNYPEGEKSFVDAAWESVKGKDVIQVFTNGNNDRANPYHRALYPYFHPEAEKQWIAIAGLRQNDQTSDPDNYKLEANFNEAGFAKYWTLTGPGQNGYTSNISGGYGSYSGTSMAAPFVSGAFAVLASRYQNMSAVQVREVLLTTANHKNVDGSNMEGWDNVDGTTPAEGEVSDRMGWGVPDLEKGMYGPGQFFNGTFTYNMSNEAAPLDVWSNDISEVALNQREKEDMEWVKTATTDGKLYSPVKVSDDEKDYKLDNTSTGEANADGKEHNYDLAGIEDKTIDLEDAKKWRTEYYSERLIDIRNKVENGQYDGSLVKQGAGKLVMTGTNTYEGTTTVEGGTLLAFQESIGTDNIVTVKSGGTFGVLAAYDDQFTKTGYKESTVADADRVSIVVEDGGKLYVSGGSDVTVQSVDFKGAKSIVVGTDGVEKSNLINAYHSGEALTGTFTSAEGTNVFEGVNTATSLGDKADSLFFKVTDATVSGSGNTLTTSIARDETVSFSDFATTHNERQIAEALEASTGGLVGSVLSMNNADQINGLYSTLADDMYASARNAMVVNALSVTRGVVDQARGLGEGRSAELENGWGRIWATGMATWTQADGQESSVDADFRVGLIGGEINVCSATKLGAFFGYGSTDYDGDFGKIDGDDMHFGVYGLTDFGPASFTYGVAYMQEDRDSVHALGEYANAHSEDASVLQAYAEGAWNFEFDAAKVSPYVGVTYARVDADGFTESAYGYDFRVKDQKDDIEVVSLGVRGTLPFMMGTMPVALKADAGWSHFFGDTEAVSEMQLGAGGAYAAIEGNELDNQFNLGLGIAMEVAKSATVNVSYSGAFGSDTDSHGIIGTFRYTF